MITPAEFRALALSFPEALEGEHMGHADFRVRKKIFATLGAPDDGWAMVKLTPEQQDDLIEAYPDVFQPVPGGWGRQGATRLRLECAVAAEAHQALLLAWTQQAPTRLRAAYTALSPDLPEVHRA